MAFAVKKALILIYWTPVWHLLLRLVQKSEPLFFDECAEVAISMNGTKVRFDECEIPWNGYMTITASQIGSLGLV